MIILVDIGSQLQLECNCDSDWLLSLPGHYLIGKQNSTESRWEQKTSHLDSLCAHVCVCSFCISTMCFFLWIQDQMAGNKPRFVICDSWMIPGPEEAGEWKNGATAFTQRGQIHLNSNSNDFLLRKLGLKKRVHLIIGSLSNFIPKIVRGKLKNRKI